jgi:uncharacterized protein
MAAPTFPPLTGRVVDQAQLLSPQTEQRLSDELAQLETKTGRQLVVATLPDLQGYEIEEYGYQLGRAWGIGRAGKNDGALLIVAPKERRVRLEVGYGLEPVLTDALSSVIINRSIVPQFKAGRYEQGVVDGTEAVIRQLSLPDDQAKAEVTQADADAPRVVIARQRQSGGGFPVGIVAIIVLFFVLRAFGARRRYGRGGGLWWLLPLILSSGGRGGGGWSGGGGSWSGGGGGFSGGGGSFGGGGASGRW